MGAFCEIGVNRRPSRKAAPRGELRDRNGRLRAHGALALVAFLSSCANPDAACPGDVTLSPEIQRIVNPSQGDLRLDGVSSDGAVVVGSMFTSGSWPGQAFRWTETTGLVPLGFVSGYDGTDTVAVSADGAVVVGTAKSASLKQQPFRWSENTGMVGLGFGTSQRDQGWTTGVSRDGSVVTGGLSNYGPGGRDALAFRWTESGGMVILELPPGASGATATNVSADGKTIVGESFADSTGNTNVFRWTESTGSVNLDAPAEAITAPLFVSDDGSVIVGVAGARGAAIAFRWTERTGFVGLGPLPGFSHSRPTGMKADGSVVVGDCANERMPSSPTEHAAFRWTEKSGLTALELVPRTAPYQGNRALAVSSDGSIVIGYDESWNGMNTGGGEWDVVMWNPQGCVTRLRPAHDPSESSDYYPEAVSGDGRTIIASVTNTASNSRSGWVVRLP